MLNFTRLFTLLLAFLLGHVALAQTRYNISNTTVTECEGILVDSEAGKDPAYPTGYAHNEDYCFTVCVPNSPKITVSFSQFSLEIPGPTETPCVNCDFVEIFDGPNCTGPRLGHWYAGNSPGTVSGTGNCISIRFRSDGNKSGEGFEMSWNATPPPPVPPVIQPIGNVNCKSTSVVINFDKPVPCAQLVAGNFTFNGPSGSAISSVTPINCVNGFASSATLNFNRQLDQSGTYCMDFTFNYTDICLKTYRFNVTQCFQIINCPLIVRITGDSIICLGDCVNLTAEVQGGNPANYQYSWNPTAPNQAVIPVCPTADQAYTVTVTDGSSQPASAIFNVKVLPLPNPGLPDSMCLFAPAVNYVGTPAGGTWSGPGITNGANGTFNPPSANYGVHNITYRSPNGCRATKRITVWLVWAGGNQSACLNSPTFQLLGYPNPPPGTWTGTNTTPSGMFSPIQTGTFPVTYTEPVHGCVSTANILVIDSIDIPPAGTISACSVQPAFLMSDKGTVSPPNGVWSGTGITNQNNGTFNPGTAGLGHHVLTYTINGCSDTTSVDVTTIDAGPDVLICPTSPSALILAGSPAKGIWSGPGIVDNGDTTYNFNPALISQDSVFTNAYTKDGCTDTRIIYLLHTTVKDTILEFCPYDSPRKLDNAALSPNIPNGVWSGSGYMVGDSINPKLLPAGTSYAYYEVAANGCIDSIGLRVKPKPFAGNDTTVCPKSGVFPLRGTPTSGTWAGTGVTNPAGTFSPAVAGQGAEGVFDVRYNLNGCEDTAQITLKAIDARFSGLGRYYCLNTNAVTLTPNPVGGTFSGPGVSGNTFDPMTAGSGMHNIVYTFGTGACTVYDTQQVQVLDPIAFKFVYPTAKLCYGDSILVRTEVQGGDSTRKFTYTWNPNKSITGQIYIKPLSFTTFTLTVSDGCSVPLTKSADIDVYPQINYNLTAGPPVCFGEKNWGKIEITTPPRADFVLQWNTEPISTADSVNVVAAKYKIDITNTVSGCKVKTTHTLPYYPYIDANFIQSPIEKCISVVDPHFDFINLSTGADRGYWSFGDSTVIPYVAFDNPGHTYADTGDYHIKLYIENSAGCKDSLETDVCIFPVKQYEMPNAFTPNDDGKNDAFPTGFYVNGKFIPIGYGITDYNMRIFDRWGKLIYETDARKTPWNGRLMNAGELQKNGVYVYEMEIFFGIRDIKQIAGRVTLVR